MPKINLESKTIDSFLLTDSTLLKTNHLGISEPFNGIQINNNQIDLVFVPLLTFDHFGHRVGTEEDITISFYLNVQMQ